MNTPENYYAILGVPLSADNDTLKRAYRQLARRYHPDIAGEAGAVEMKRINRAYAVLSDPEKRQHYDTVIGGVLDLRARFTARPQRKPQRGDSGEDFAFSGLDIFSTHGPLKAGLRIRVPFGVISSISCIKTTYGLLLAAGSIDGQVTIWQIIDGQANIAKTFTPAPGATVESIRELRFSEGGALLAGWNRLNIHVWDSYSGELLWHSPLQGRAVAAHYSLDIIPHVINQGEKSVQMALPYLAEDVRAPSAWGVRATDVLTHDLTHDAQALSNALTCLEDKLENRHFWAIRMRALAWDRHTLVTLSCAQVPEEKQQMAIVRRWNLTSKARIGGKVQPQIEAAILVGRCEDCTPPYVATSDANRVAFVYAGKTIRICDIAAGTYQEVLSGTMGGSARMAISHDGQFLAVAREDSEVNEGVIDLWSIPTGQILQKFYHPWSISALQFIDHQLVVALTDGTLQLWQ